MGQSNSQRLDSWKQIAEFLGHSTRTAQRWHAMYGLPVYRAADHNSSVFAFPHELLAWMKRSGDSADASLIDPTRTGRRGGEPKESLTSSGLAHRPVIDRPVDSAAIANASQLAARGYSLWRILSPTNIHKITESFRAATNLDPDNALAFSGLAHALCVQGLIGMLRIPDAYRMAKAAADYAADLEPESDEVRSAVAWSKLVWERDWRGAHSIFGDLVQRPSLNGRAMAGYGMLLIGEGHTHHASEVFYEVSLQEPLIPGRWAMRCWADYLSQEYDEAKEHILEFRQSGNCGRIVRGVEALGSLQADAPATSIVKIGELIEQDPGFPLLRGALGHAHANNRDFDQARFYLHGLTKDRSHANQVSSYAISLILVALGEHEQALRALEQSYSVGSLWSLGFHSDPALKALQNQPAFKAFLQRAYPLDQDFSLT